MSQPDAQSKKGSGPMNFKTTYILFGILALILIALGFALFTGQTRPDSIYVFPSANEEGNPVNAADIQTISIKRKGGDEIVLERKSGNEWKMETPHDLRVSQRDVDNLADSVLRLRRNDKIKLPKDPGKFDLSPPLQVITLKTKEGKPWALNVGATSAGGDKVIYVTTGEDEKQPVAVDASALPDIHKGVTDFREKTLLADRADQVKVVRLQGKDGKTVELTKKGENRWVITKPDLGDAELGSAAGGFSPHGPPPATAEGVEGLLRQLTDVQAESFGEINASDKDLAAKGLGEKDADLTITVEAAGEGGANRKRTLLIGKADPKDAKKLYARLADEKNVEEVAGQHLELARKVLGSNAEDLRNRRLVPTDLGHPDAVNLTTETGKELRLRQRGGKWWLYRDKAGKAEAIDGKQVTSLITALANAKTEEFVPGTPKFNVTQPVVVSFWHGDYKSTEEKDDKKEKEPPEPELKDPNKPALRLSFDRPAGGSVLIKRLRGDDGRADYVKAAASVYQAVAKEAVYFYATQQPQLPPITDLQRIDIQRGGITYQADRVTKDGKSKWTLASPAEMKGRPADESSLLDVYYDLARLTAVENVAEKPGDPLLGTRYGLKKPAAAVTFHFKKDGKDEKIEYQFGNKADDKNGYYTKRSGSDVIFVTPADRVDKVLNAALLDTTVFDFDASKAVGLKLNGWSEQLIGARAFELERPKGKDWAFKGTPPFPLDPAKVSDLVNKLAHLRAKEFAGTGAPKPDDKSFNVANNALEVSVTLDGEKKPLMLTVGGKAGDKGYYARSSQMSGVFILDPKSLGDLLQGPQTLKKAS
jgi:hypothetical protein